MASAAQSAETAIQRTFVHELGHYLLFNLIKRDGRDAVEALISPVYKAARSGGHIVTSRAEENWQEYFCEVFSASTYHKQLLMQHDPEGYKMVLAIRKALEVDE